MMLSVLRLGLLAGLVAALDHGVKAFNVADASITIGVILLA
jgi:lipoprotein signal peptidase